MTLHWKSVIAGIVGTLLLLALIGLIVVLTGAYNVAATDRHGPIAGWALDTTYHNSVQRQADGLVPPEFTPAMIASGGGEYKEYCAHCHGGVGSGRAEWATGMRPHPPALARAAEEWTEQEVFWLVSHGVKMSGMPAFGPTHDEQTIWNITAFVKAMPDMSAEEYATIGGSGHSHGGGGSHEE